MKAAILTTLGAPLEVADIGLPDDLACGQVFVRIIASTVCGAQINEVSGAKGPDKFLPHLLGHEGAGIVEAVGPGVRHVAVKDCVVMHWRKGPGIDAAFPKYKWGDKTVGGGSVTTFSECAVVSENRLTAVPPDIPVALVSLLGCAVTTGFGIVYNEAQLKPGPSIAVAGCGGVGLAVVNAADIVCARRIIGIDVESVRLERAKAIGATQTFEPVAFFDRVEKSDDELVDVFVDTTGYSLMIDAGMHYLTPGGKMVLAGQPRFGSSIELTNARQHYCGKTIFDSQGGLTNPPVDIPRYIHLWRKGKLMLWPMIGAHFTLDQVNEASAYKGAGRAILEMER